MSIFTTYFVPFSIFVYKYVCVYSSINSYIDSVDSHYCAEYLSKNVGDEAGFSRSNSVFHI